MQCIISTNHNPHFNLATEEYFLKTDVDEIFLLYINEPSIIVGKHQNILSEINLPFVQNEKIKLARRISGGGTVYQDNNNLNFSFIYNCLNLEQINFRKFTMPILDSLKEEGLNVQFSDRHDIILDGHKISGNAMHVYRSRVLSHGTLLFNSNLNTLSMALRNHPEKYIDKSIKSVKSKVANISDYLSNQIDINTFQENIFNSTIRRLINPTIRELTRTETESINKLSMQKFESLEWIYGYSPKYSFINTFSNEIVTIKFELKIENGLIKSVVAEIKPITNSIYQIAFDLIQNERHHYPTIKSKLEQDKLIKNSKSIDISAFCHSLF